MWMETVEEEENFSSGMNALFLVPLQTYVGKSKN